MTNDLTHHQTTAMAGTARPRLERPAQPVKKRQDDFTSFPEIGRLALGINHGPGRGMEETPHFVIDPGGPIAKVYGPEPKELKVAFLSNDINDHIITGWRVFGRNNRLKCISYDGVQALQENAVGVKGLRPCPQDCIENGKPVPPDAQCAMRTYVNKKGETKEACAFKLRLTFMLPDVSFNGVFRLYHGSVIGVGRLIDMFNYYNAMSKPFGGIIGKPMILFREEVKTPHPDDRTKMIPHWPLNLRMAEEYDDAVKKGYLEATRFHMGRILDTSAVESPQLTLQPNDAPLALNAPHVVDVELVEAPQTADQALHEAVDPDGAASIAAAKKNEAHIKLNEGLKAHAAQGPGISVVFSFFHQWVEAEFGINLGVVDDDTVFRISMARIDEVRSAMNNHFASTGRLPWEKAFDDTITEEDLK